MGIMEKKIQENGSYCLRFRVDWGRKKIFPPLWQWGIEANCAPFRGPYPKSFGMVDCIPGLGDTQTPQSQAGQDIAHFCDAGANESARSATRQSRCRWEARTQYLPL